MRPRFAPARGLGRSIASRLFWRFLHSLDRLTLYRRLIRSKSDGRRELNERINANRLDRDDLILS